MLAPFLTLRKKQKANVASEQVDVNRQLIFQLNKRKVPSWQQLKKFGEVLNKKEKIQSLTAMAVLILALAGLGWRWFINNSIAEAAYGGSYTEGLIGSTNFINPILATSDADHDLVTLIFSGLVKFDEQGNIVPDLAAGYTIDAEQKVYTFELKPNAYWHDGEQVLADDVVFTVNRIKNPEFKSPLRSNFNGVQVNQLNDSTVQFTLDKPFASFLSLLTVGILPEHIWYGIPDFSAELAEYNKKPIGSGPYKFQSLTKDANGNIKNYTLVAFDQYHFGRPFIEEIIFKFYTDYDSAVSALQNKNIEGLVYLPREYQAAFKNNDVDFKHLHSSQYTAVFFNPNNNPLLGELKFRRALALGVDRQRILTEALNDDGQLINSPILPGLFGHDPEINDLGFDPVAAKALLDELEWKFPENNAGKFRQKNEQELSVKLTTVDQPQNVKAISVIRENWESLGIKTELEIIPKNEIKKNIIEPRNYQLLLFGQIINATANPYPFWHSSQIQNPGLNLSILTDKDIDQSLDQIRNATSDQGKLEPLKNFQTKLNEQQFAIFLYNPNYTYPVSRKLKGLAELKLVNLPSDRFVNINTWYIKTKRHLNSN